jgi:hypothetical protein
VHKLRTRIRRWEASLDSVDVRPKGRERKVMKALRRIHKQAGKVRDLDVFTSHLASLHSAGNDDCLVQFLLQYRGKTAEACIKVSSTVGDRAAARIIDACIHGDAEIHLGLTAKFRSGSARLPQAQRRNYYLQ